MAPSKTPVNVRIAESSDTKLVAHLCRRAVGSGDYVLRILRDVIAEGGLFLAWSDDELVGMTNLDGSIDGTGWLSMARIDPKWRRKGIALSLQRYIISYARRRGIGALRLWTLSTNTPSIKVCRKGGFKPVCEAAHISCSTRATRKPRRVAQLSPKAMGSVRSLSRSPYLGKMNSYFAYKWHFVKANRELLGKLVRKGELFWDDESAFILTKPEISFGSPHSSFTLLHGPALLSLRKVKETAKNFGPVGLGSYLPYNAHLLKSAKRTGFTRDPWEIIA